MAVTVGEVVATRGELAVICGSEDPAPRRIADLYEARSGDSAVLLSQVFYIYATATRTALAEAIHIQPSAGTPTWLVILHQKDGSRVGDLFPTLGSALAAVAVTEEMVEHPAFRRDEFESLLAEYSGDAQGLLSYCARNVADEGCPEPSV